MTTVKIDISDQQAAALSEKAAAQGMTLERWFQKVAGARGCGRYAAAKDPMFPVLEAAARDAKRGLWSLPEADRIPPWDWR